MNKKYKNFRLNFQKHRINVSKHQTVKFQISNIHLILKNVTSVLLRHVKHVQYILFLYKQFDLNTCFKCESHHTFAVKTRTYVKNVLTIKYSISVKTQIYTAE